MGKTYIRDPMKTRRLFGKAGGMHSTKSKKRQKALFIKQQERVHFYAKDKARYPPYQLIRKQTVSSGCLSTKLIVRRIPIYKDRSSKLLKLGKTSMKFKFEPVTNTVSGYRIINLDMLKTHIVDITTHSCLCLKAQDIVKSGKDPIRLKSEICRNGLFSILLAECQGCKKQFPLRTSTKMNNDYFDINVRAVWGSVASGGGSTDLNEVLSTMNVPPMSERMFSRLEENIGSWWEECLKDEMAKAGAEERRLAVERGSFHHGIPSITVICDGGWSKRTHKHSYNAFGGVGVIFGAVTEKLLFMGVRNKQCILCDKAERNGTTPALHKCFKNWVNSSQAMEADIILEGFLEAESRHGLRYMNIIADGDSSVYTQLQENVPVWGGDIIKLECANHTCKCVRSNLEKLVTEKPHYKGRGKLTTVNRIRLTTAIRCAIKMRSKERNSKLLRHDILNSVYHILGFHKFCSNFCNKKTDKVNNEEDNDECIENDTFQSSFDEIFEQQYNYWKIPSNAEMEESRLAVKSLSNVNELKDIIADVQIILNRVADKCDRLMGNFTTNLAESWMGIRAKFDGGKVINRCGRGSWHTRCYGGALRKNLGVEWSPLAFQTITGTQAGSFFNKGVRRQAQKLKAGKRYRAKPESKTVRRKRKLQSLKESSSKKARLHYGSQLDDSPDVAPEKLSKTCIDFVKARINKTPAEIEDIKKRTVDQSRSDLWKKERHIRLTSSNFGKVMKRRTNNVSNKMIKTMLYTTFKGNIHTIRGLQQEANTIIEYKNIKPGVTVERVGLQISSSHPCLAASTDGLVTHDGETGLLEIKNFLQTNTYLLKEAIEKVPNFCLQLCDNEMKLKKTHEIYYQIQGQLNVFEVDWCDFVVRRTNPYDIHIERIYRDHLLWITDMVPKLEAFYKELLLPELALPRYGTYTGIRQPKSRWFAATTGKLTRQSKKPSNQKTVHKRPKVKCVDPVKGSTSDLPDVGASGSTLPIQQQPSCSSVEVTHMRSRRQRNVKFVGRKILHEWCVNEKKKKNKWFSGTVLDVIKGKDGDPKAVYEVLYHGEDTPHEVDSLHADFMTGSVKFDDI